jgi:hypothetical protein
LFITLKHPGLNLDQNTDYPDWGQSWFLSKVMDILDPRTLEWGRGILGICPSPRNFGKNIKIEEKKERSQY